MAGSDLHLVASYGKRGGWFWPRKLFVREEICGRRLSDEPRMGMKDIYTASAATGNPGRMRDVPSVHELDHMILSSLP